MDKKIRLTLPFTHISNGKEDKAESHPNRERIAELRRQQQYFGFIKPRNFEKMSYIMHNRRNFWNFGDLGYVWCHDFRRQDLCEEFFNRPFIIFNGNVEACGNCNTFLPGNLHKSSFKEIWNCPLYQEVRRRMYHRPLKQWYRPCQHCICMFVKYNRESSDHRFTPFYRILQVDGKEIPKEEADNHWIRQYKPMTAQSPQDLFLKIKQFTPPPLWRIAGKINKSLRRILTNHSLKIRT